MIFALLIGTTLVVLTSFLHFLALRKSATLVDPAQHASRCFITSTCVIIVMHLITALVFAATFHISEFSLGLGTLSFSNSQVDLTFMDRFYFSLVNLTTLGRGDLIPSGHLRFLTAMEALLGFLVITGSGAFLLRIIHGDNPLKA